MKIWLDETSNLPFWYLGHPRQAKIALSISNPGPVSIEFESLSLDEQKTLLFALKNSKIKTNVPFDSLHKLWKDRNQIVSATTLEPPPEVKKYLDDRKILKEQNKLLRLKAEQEEKDRKIIEKCEYLINKTTRAVKYSTNHETDIRLFRFLKQLELKKNKKPRVILMDYLEEKIRKIEYQMQQSIIKQSGGLNLESTSKIELEPKTSEYDLVESESKEVSISLDELQGFLK